MGEGGTNEQEVIARIAGDRDLCGRRRYWSRGECRIRRRGDRKLQSREAGVQSCRQLRTNSDRGARGYRSTPRELNLLVLRAERWRAAGRANCRARAELGAGNQGGEGVSPASWPGMQWPQRFLCWLVASDTQGWPRRLAGAGASLVHGRLPSTPQSRT